MDRIIVDINTNSTSIVELTPEEINAVLLSSPTKTQQKNKEIKDRTDQYKHDLLELQVSWLSASVVDGDTESTKKSAVLLDIETLKTEYTNDIAAIKIKYQN